ncbi:MAG: class I SAM-dependent methyltransferase, partial [Clostridia bacterium]|nr:class I SAM-dependent methyltransferase [Clostridia bacterium]
LPRVQKAIGFLKGVWPESLLDVGSGRGVFLFPFLEAFPFTPVTSADILDYRVEFLEDIALGGVQNLTAVQESICTFDAPDKSFDVVTMLEVLEHIPEVEKAVFNAVRLAKRYVVVSVPSKEDNNPEHIHLLTKDILTDLFTRAGAKNMHFDGVNGHLFMTARV